MQNKKYFFFVHFPPNYWRLHIHFVQKNHIFQAPAHEIFFIDEIIIYYYNNPGFFLKNVRIFLNSNIINPEKNK